MKFDFISDIHIDNWLKDIYAEKNEAIEYFITNILFDQKPPKEKREVLIISGDIGHYIDTNITFLKKIKKYYHKIGITFGNHDMYLENEKERTEFKLSSYKKIKKFKDEILKIKDIYFLDGTTFTHKGIKFGGLCGWYDVGNKKELWKHFSNDSMYIYMGENYLEYDNELALFQYGYFLPDIEPKQILEKETKKLEKLTKHKRHVDVLVSHIPQILKEDLKKNCSKEILEQLEKYEEKDEILNGDVFYYIDNKELLYKTQAKIYLFGHTHLKDIDMKINIKDKELRVISNCLGYSKENLYTKIETYKV